MTDFKKPSALKDVPIIVTDTAWPVAFIFESIDRCCDDCMDDINKQLFCPHNAGSKFSSYPVWENSFAAQSGNPPVGIKTVKICDLCGGALNKGEN